MPLSSKNLDESTKKYRREMPLDKECLGEIPYQTKVELYDKRCNGCGFARILVQSGKGFADEFETNDIDEAIRHARNLHDRIIRSCSYPADITEVNGKIVYPTITEIVSNGCQFWNEDKMNIFDDSETMFIEIMERDFRIKMVKEEMLESIRISKV